MSNWLAVEYFSVRAKGLSKSDRIAPDVLQMQNVMQVNFSPEDFCCSGVNRWDPCLEESNQIAVDAGNFDEFPLLCIVWVGVM